MPLTDTFVRNAKPTGIAPRKVADGHGLSLLVHPTGAKSFVQRYADPITGKERTYTIGAYPAVKLGAARERAAEVRSLVQLGRCPVEADRVQKSLALASTAHTFSIAAENWLKGQRAMWSEATHRRNALIVGKWAIPAWRDRPIESITRADVIALIKTTAGKQATAEKLVQSLRAMFESVGLEGPTNPAMAFSRTAWRNLFPATPSGHYAAVTTSDSFAELLRITWGASCTPSVSLALRYLVYTAGRTGEAIGLQWGMVDFDNHVITIPPAVMKMRREHLVPIAPQVLALLREIAGLYPKNACTPTAPVFPSPNDESAPFSEEAMRRTLRRAGVAKTTATVHGFRSSFSSLAREKLDARHEVVELCLAHVDGSVAGIYNRSVMLEQRRELLSAWANWCDSARQACPAGGADGVPSLG
ncbi:MAG: tyrosine-type recombinase/integrase [Rhodoferax sp.]|nr:tyrosine-type recombinase/integrase [Rhodoferax sp.]MBP9059011.1 tyrosine-type recombinase/integrase [Rhodoferax sp.]